MTFEELKAEASRQGYNLVKKPTYIPLTPCICGSKRGLRMTYTTGFLRFYRCIKCGLEGKKADSNKEARLNWNRAMEKFENIEKD